MERRAQPSWIQPSFLVLESIGVRVCFRLLSTIRLVLERCRFPVLSVHGGSKSALVAVWSLGLCLYFQLVF